MSSRQLTFEEELIRQAADRPLPSAGLRNRVIAAAERAARRRLRARRAIAALFLGGWLASSVMWGRSVESDLTTRAPGGDIAAESGASEVFAAQRQATMCCLGEWAHVEFFVRLREVQGQILRGAY